MVETEYSSLSMERQMQAAYFRLDQKLVWLPIVFLLLRMWGIIRFFISIWCDRQVPDGCCSILHNQVLIYLQSICDPGQGWSNALLFVIFNQKIAYRLFPCLQPLGEWCSLRLKGLVPRKWRGERKVQKKAFESGTKEKAKNIQQVPTGDEQVGVKGRPIGGGGQREDERTSLLFNDSIASTSTNMSSSVLYHSAGTTPVAGEVGGVKVSKPRNPSINSRL